MTPTKITLVSLDTHNIGSNLKNKFGEHAKLSFANFHQRVTEGCITYQAIAYGSHVGDKAKDFIWLLKKCGFDPRFRDLKTRRDNETGKDVPVYIGNVVDMTVDIMETISLGKIEKLVLCTSDPQFARLIEYAKRHGIEVVVASSRIPPALKNVANSFIEIDESLLHVQGESSGLSAEVSI